MNRMRGHCRFLDRYTGLDKVCLECHGKVSLKVFACSVYGQCTIEKPADAMGACCSTCKDWQPKES
jgi:hypothetical protein